MKLPNIDLREATRLTREGRLNDALAALKRALPGMAQDHSTLDLGAGLGAGWARRKTS